MIAGELNPLANLSSHTTNNLLVAFEFSEDAYTANINENIGETGTIVNASKFGGICGGKAVVVINELIDASASITQAETTWAFFSPVNHRTSSYVGNMLIHDRTGFLFTQKIKEFVDKMGMSIHHLTFSWIPIITGLTEQHVSTRIPINPMFFHVSKFTQSVSEYNGRSYMLDIVGCYNTHGTSPQFADIQQNTVASDININALPRPIKPSSGIRSTKSEDADKIKTRETNNQLIGNMKTIGQFCKSFEASLNYQTVPHKLQLQRFMEIIHDDYTKKVDSIVNKEELPIEYKISADTYYSNKKIDNRNLPFEQISQNQHEPGITSITFPQSYNIHLAIAQVMRMSKDIGREHMGVDVDTFKLTTTTSRTCNGKYLINTKINHYKSPYNSANSIDTGPGDNLLHGNGIYYTYQDTDDSNSTLINMTYSVLPQLQLDSITEVDDRDDAQAVYGDREQNTSVRYTKDFNNFFNNAFSGINSMRGSFTDISVQNSQYAAAITNFKPTQSISYALNIIGNPHLLGDINRNPLDVISGTDKYGHYNIYSNTEYSPMYLKLKISIGDDSSQSPEFYYNGYLHIHTIVNTFIGGSFTQTLHCSRNEENT